MLFVEQQTTGVCHENKRSHDICYTSQNEPPAVSQHAPVVKSLFSSLPTEKRDELACIRHENWFVANQQLKLLFHHYLVLLKIINVSRLLPSQNTFN